MPPSAIEPIKKSPLACSFEQMFGGLLLLQQQWVRTIPTYLPTYLLTYIPTYLWHKLKSRSRNKRRTHFFHIYIEFWTIWSSPFWETAEVAHRAFISTESALRRRGKRLSVKIGVDNSINSIVAKQNFWFTCWKIIVILSEHFTVSVTTTARRCVTVCDGVWRWQL